VYDIAVLYACDMKVCVEEVLLVRQP